MRFFRNFYAYSNYFLYLAFINSFVQFLKLVSQSTNIFIEELAELDEKIKAVQLGLVDRATSSEGYEDLARESDRLNEEKQKILVTLAEDKGRQEKKAELIDFLHEQTTEFEKFDDGLVRRNIGIVLKRCRSD